MRKRVLFVGSDPNYNHREEDLRARGEHTIAVQQEREVLHAVYRGRQSFKFEPPVDNSTWTQFSELIQDTDPSILHLCAHGTTIRDEGIVLFQDDVATGFEARAESLAAVLKRCPNLELVYLDACKSAEVARNLVRIPDVRFFCVGFDNDIPVDASTRGSGIFHSNIANGACVSDAVSATRDFLGGVPGWNNARPHLFKPDYIEPRPIRVFPKISAKFFKHDPRPDDTGSYTINFGLIVGDANGPHNADDEYLICFFSDQRDYISQDYVTLVKDQPNLRRELWHPRPSKECWDYDADGKIYCTYVHLNTGFSETISCRLSEALSRHYEGLEPESTDAAEINAAIAAIRT